jgi:hypothetical protein
MSSRFENFGSATLSAFLCIARSFNIFDNIFAKCYALVIEEPSVEPTFLLFMDDLSLGEGIAVEGT